MLAVDRSVLKYLMHYCSIVSVQLTAEKPIKCEHKFQIAEHEWISSTFLSTNIKDKNKAQRVEGCPETERYMRFIWAKTHYKPTKVSIQTCIDFSFGSGLLNHG